MKLLQGAAQLSGYRLVHLVDPEDLDLLRFEETGEIPEGLDFAILWSGVWGEGRCYGSFPGGTFVTYDDANRLPLHAGMLARLPHYTLGPERLLADTEQFSSRLHSIQGTLLCKPEMN